MAIRRLDMATTVTVETAIVNAIKGVIGGDWATIQEGVTTAATELASVSMDLANPNNTMTADEKKEIIGDQEDSLKNAVAYGRVVADVVVKQAIDAAVQAIVTELPALIGIA
jgi:hypothetical protein